MPIALLLLACLTAQAPPAQGCSDCHGSPASPAPPSALGGGTARSDRGVGAHEVHLLGSPIAGPVACAECHHVPGSTDAEGHVDTPWPAEVGWADSTLAKSGAEPFDAAGLTCTVYCHGASMGEGPSPPWTSEDGLGCAGCHGFPPAPPHPDAPECASCHPVGAGLQVDPAVHVNGVVDFLGGPSDTGETGGCAGCHGSGDHLAPPPDTEGRTDTTLLSVGAHAVHVDGSASSAPVPCATCHPIPATVDAPGHRDGEADVVFSGLATTAAGGSVSTFSPAWDEGSATCAGTACHARGGTAPAPVWNQVDGTQATCGSCHALPPPSPHPASSSCSGCHPTAGPGPAIVDPAHHADGRVDL